MYVRASLLGLEEENGAVSEVEVDEVFRLVCNKASEIPPYDTMPCSSFARVKLSLDVLGNVLLNVVLLHCLDR